MPARPSPFRLAVDTMLDHFRIVRLIGSGATGEVYLARDTKLARKVAVKVVKANIDETGLRDAFLEEARATARFNHPHIVSIYAVGEVRGRPYVVLEYLEGGNLRKRLGEGRRMARPVALRFALAVAKALAEAHSRDILHRDLKPENIIVPADGRLRVVDFGLARLASTVGDGDEDGEPVGTPEYMAPEQWLDIEVTTAVDVWSLGVVLFEMVAGTVPFPFLDSMTLGDLARTICDPDPTPRLSHMVEAPGELDGLIARMLDKDPTLRPSAGDVVRELELMLGTKSAAVEEGSGAFRGHSVPTTSDTPSSTSDARRRSTPSSSAYGANRCFPSRDRQARERRRLSRPASSPGFANKGTTASSSCGPARLRSGLSPRAFFLRRAT